MGTDDHDRTWTEPLDVPIDRLVRRQPEDSGPAAYRHRHVDARILARAFIEAGVVKVGELALVRPEAARQILYAVRSFIASQF